MITLSKPNPIVLVALPVYNERAHVAEVLQEVQKHNPHVLVVDDGSSDGTDEELDGFPNVDVVRHEVNAGYGAALRSAFLYAIAEQYDVLVTIDCDGQHQPELIPALAERVAGETDIVSGSRYLLPILDEQQAPADRRRINGIITAELNERLGLSITDAFCGFKAYRVSALKSLSITETGYAMPLQLWVQAVAAGLTIEEFPVPLIYLDEERSFGGSLDDAERRLSYYRTVLNREIGGGLLCSAEDPCEKRAKPFECEELACLSLPGDCKLS